MQWYTLLWGPVGCFSVSRQCVNPSSSFWRPWWHCPLRWVRIRPLEGPAGRTGECPGEVPASILPIPFWGRTRKMWPIPFFSGRLDGLIQLFVSGSYWPKCCRIALQAACGAFLFEKLIALHSLVLPLCKPSGILYHWSVCHELKLVFCGFQKSSFKPIWEIPFSPNLEDYFPGCHLGSQSFRSGYSFL